MAAWAKRFPDEFYRQIFRLRGWQWRGMKINRPSVVGRYTVDLVYDRLAPDIYKNLVARMPLTESGNRKGNLQQLFTEDVGHPALQAHLAGSIDRGLQHAGIVAMPLSVTTACQNGRSSRCMKVSPWK
jgi:hypothetical protein